MKKHLILYVLLIFLIIVNAFFLFNYMGKSNDKNPKEPQRNKDFIVKELGFTATQLKQFREKSKGHHKTIIYLSDVIRSLKDELFDKLSEDSVNKVAIDSITSLIGEKVKEKDLEAFYHFKMIQELCNDKQKEKFKSIIKDALHKGGKGDRSLPKKGPRGQRPPRND